MTPDTPQAKPPTTMDEFMALPAWSRFLRDPHPTIPGVMIPRARRLLAFYVPDNAVLTVMEGRNSWSLVWDGQSFGRMEGP